MFLRNLYHRRGAVLLEATLALPVLVLITLAAVQFGQATVVEQAIGAAADEAAREAAKGASQTEVQMVVNQMLQTVSLMAADGFAGVRVDVERSDTNLNYYFGDEDLGPPSNPVSLQPNDVRVTIRANYTATKVPNTLGYFGIDLQDRRFQSSALAQFQ